jgi:glycosyltransferase involved in cell wall biosynthesis
MQAETFPLVSVGLPTFNRSSSLSRAINSVLHQTYPNIELIISDNASTDETQLICEKFTQHDKRVTYIRQKSNLGAANNFMEVLKQSTGEYFMWLGDDDWIDIHYIDNCQVFLRDNPNYLLCSGIAKYYIGSSVNIGEAIHLTEDSPIKRVKKYFREVKDNGIFYGLYRKEVLLQLVPPWCFGGDWIFIACIALLGKVNTLNTCIVHRLFQEKNTECYAKQVDPKHILEKSYPYLFICFHLFSVIRKTPILQNILSKYQETLLFFDILLTLIARFGHLYSDQYGKLNIFRVHNKLVYLLKPLAKKIIKLYLHCVDFLKTLIYILVHISVPYKLWISDGQKQFNLDKLAFFSPVYPIESGISDYSEELLRFLSRKYQTFVFIDESYTAEQCPNIENTIYLDYRLFPVISKIFGIRSIIYQVGSSSYHNYMFKFINRNPGLVVLHDGIHMAGNILKASINHKIIVHSLYAATQVKTMYPNVTINIVNQLMGSPKVSSNLDKRLLKNELKIDKDAFVFGVFGIISQPKMIYELLSAFCKSFVQNENVVFLMVGYQIADPRVLDFLRFNKYDSRLVCKLGVSKEDLYKFIYITDVCFNLRAVSRGETSSSLLRVMSCGIPVVASDIDSFSELPSDILVKVPPNLSESELSSMLTKFYREKDDLKEIGARAQSYIKLHHHPERIASIYSTLIEAK